MCVGVNGFLQHLYYGAKVKDVDALYLSEKVGKPQDSNCADNARDVRTNELWSEFSSFGRGDYHEPCALIRRTDGSVMSLFRYASHSVVDGAPVLDGLPHTRYGEQTLCIKLRDDFSDVEIALYYIVDGNSDVLVRHAEYVNKGAENMRLEKAFSFVLDLPDSDFKLLRLQGNQTYECYPEISPLAHGITKLQSLRGISSHQLNPFAAFLRPNTDEEQGVCYGVQLIYSGSWVISAEVNNCDTLRVQGGINDSAFCWNLKRGEIFTTPQVALCYSENGLGGMSREYHDFIRSKIMPPRFARSVRPIVVNNWEATYFDFTYDKLFKIIDEAAVSGIDTFVLDDGWFGARNWDNVALGDWFVNKEKLPQGLTPLIERCKSRGLKFGLWFEPEMISEESELYRTHLDWALNKAGQNPMRWRTQLVLDFTNSDVTNYVFEAVSKILSENEISYIKWDMNRSLSEFFSNSLSFDKQGEVAHRYMLGVYDLANRLTSAFPDVFFEGCASGGGRFDAGMMYYFPQIWTSDDTDGFERSRIQWGASLCYPPSAMSCHVSACPNHQTGRTVPFDTRGAIASLGAMGYELDLSAISKSDKQKVASQIRYYTSMRDLVLDGDLYRLSNPFEQNYFAEMLVSKDKRRAILIGEQFRATPNGHYKEKYLRLVGLDETKLYAIDGIYDKVSGAALSNFGVPLPHLEDYGSFVWQINEVEEN